MLVLMLTKGLSLTQQLNIEQKEKPAKVLVVPKRANQLTTALVN